MIKLKIVEKKADISNDWSIEKVATEYPPFTWEKVFESAKDEIKDISDLLEVDKLKGDIFLTIKICFGYLIWYRLIRYVLSF